MTSRKNRVLSSQDYGFSAASFDGENASDAARLVFDKLTKDLERLNMRSLITSILDAPFYGMTPLEIMWEASENWWHIKDIIARPYYWFAFDENNKPFFKGDYYGAVKKIISRRANLFLQSIIQVMTTLTESVYCPAAYGRFRSSTAEQSFMPSLLKNTAPPG